MTPGTRPSRFGYVSATAAFFLAGIFAGCGTPTEPEVVAELQVDRDYKGQVYGIAFDRAGNAWMATPRTLYKVQGGKPEAVYIAAGKYDQLVLAPGGGIYARLVAGAVPGGLYTVRLMKIPKEPIAELRLPDFPFGFGALYLGGAGDLIVTITPLDSPEGLGGRFRYVFWSREGHILSEVTLDGLRTGVMDVAGKALLLLGEKEAIALSNAGRELWRLDGSFRKGALAADGQVALLNPARVDAINEVHVFRNRTVTPIKMESTVYDLALAADGSVGAIGVDLGKLFFISPASCNQSCQLREVLELPKQVPKDFLISAIRFVDRTTLAVGVIRRVGTELPFVWPGGVALAINTSGEVLLKKNVSLEQPATWAPLIDASYGIGYFAAHTPHRALIISLAP